MKKILLTSALLFSLLATSLAQTNLTQVPDLLPPLGTNNWLDIGLQELGASGIANATNYAIAPYATYAPKAPEKIGGGVLVVYNVNSYVGAAMGADYLGQFSLVSGNITFKADTHPFQDFAIFNRAPAWLKGITVTPFSLLGVGQPFGGTSGQGAATIWDVGGYVKFSHLWGGRFCLGGTWGEWQNAGVYSGHRYHAFAGWQWGF